MPNSNKNNKLLSSFGELDGNFNLINYVDLIQKSGKYFLMFIILCKLYVRLQLISISLFSSKISIQYLDIELKSSDKSALAQRS